MLFVALVTFALIVIIVLGGLLSQAVVLWLGLGVLALAVLLIIGGVAWPKSDRHWDAVDEYFDDRASPLDYAVLGLCLAPAGAVLALVGAIPW